MLGSVCTPSPERGATAGAAAAGAADAESSAELYAALWEWEWRSIVLIIKLYCNVVFVEISFVYINTNDHEQPVHCVA